MVDTPIREGEVMPCEQEGMVLNKFKHAVTKPLPESILQQPKVKQHVAVYKAETEACRRLRSKNKMKKQRVVIKLAQEVLARKWGILAQDKELESITLQQYLDIYKKPLSISAMQAIKSLSEVAELAKKKKRGTKADGDPSRTKKAEVQAMVLEA